MELKITKNTVDNNERYREQIIAELRSLIETYIYDVIYLGNLGNYYIEAIENIFNEIYSSRYETYLDYENEKGVD